MLPHYLIATWAKVCQAMGPEFEPYLPAVMPQLLRAASVKADVSIYGSFTAFPTSLPSTDASVVRCRLSYVACL